MIDYVDESIGRVFEHLKQTGEFDNTLIVVMSDNGPSRTSITDYLALGGASGDFFNSFDNSLENRGLPGSSTDIGPGWAFASATPLRLFKGYVTQGVAGLCGFERCDTTRCPHRLFQTSSGPKILKNY